MDHLTKQSFKFSHNCSFRVFYLFVPESEGNKKACLAYFCVNLAITTILSLPWQPFTRLCETILYLQTVAIL